MWNESFLLRHVNQSMVCFAADRLFSAFDLPVFFVCLRYVHNTYLHFDFPFLFVSMTFRVFFQCLFRDFQDPVSWKTNAVFESINAYFHSPLQLQKMYPKYYKAVRNDSMNTSSTIKKHKTVHKITKEGATLLQGDTNVRGQLVQQSGSSNSKRTNTPLFISWLWDVSQKLTRGTQGTCINTDSWYF